MLDFIVYLKEKYEKTIQEWIDRIKTTVIVLSFIAMIGIVLIMGTFSVVWIGYIVSDDECYSNGEYYALGLFAISAFMIFIVIVTLLCAVIYHIFKTLYDFYGLILTEYKEFKKDKTGLLTPLITAKI
jgi:predicted membrane protein